MADVERAGVERHVLFLLRVPIFIRCKTAQLLLTTELALLLHGSARKPYCLIGLSGSAWQITAQKRLASNP